MRLELTLPSSASLRRQGAKGLAQLAAIITDESNREFLPSAMERALQTIVDQLTALELQNGTMDRAIHAHHHANNISCRLETVPGIGIIGATVLASTVTDPSGFKTGRDFAAWIGLVPRQHSTGGKERLGGISKQGDRYIRRLLVIGATAVVRQARQHPQKHPWIMKLLAKKPAGLVAVAVADGLARMAWAIIAGGYYRRRRSLQLPEEARQWEREATLEQDESNCEGDEGRHDVETVGVDWENPLLKVMGEPSPCE